MRALRLERPPRLFTNCEALEARARRVGSIPRLLIPEALNQAPGAADLGQHPALAAPEDTAQASR